MIFVLEKVSNLLLMPLTVGLALLWVGFLFRRFKTVARAALIAGLLIISLLSYQASAVQFIKHLELCYPPLTELDRVPDAGWVVVLGGGHNPNPDRPANLQIGSSTPARLVDGLRVHRQLPSSRLLLSGFSQGDLAPEGGNCLARVHRAFMGQAYLLN